MEVISEKIQIKLTPAQVKEAVESYVKKHKPEYAAAKYSVEAKVIQRDITVTIQQEIAQSVATENADDNQVVTTL